MLDLAIPAPPPAEADAVSLGTLMLHGRRCVVLCVDGQPPRQHTRPGAARQRHVYHGAELAHFQWGEHRYVVVPDDDSDAVDGAGSAGGTGAVGAARASGETASRDPASALRQLLTNRELQIVQLICLGLLTKQVAGRLNLSEFTVRSYLKTIYCKLGVRSRGAMVFAYASAFGVAPPAELPRG